MLLCTPTQIYIYIYIYNQTETRCRFGFKFWSVVMLVITGNRYTGTETYSIKFLLRESLIESYYSYQKKKKKRKCPHYFVIENLGRYHRNHYGEHQWKRNDKKKLKLNVWQISIQPASLLIRNRERSLLSPVRTMMDNLNCSLIKISLRSINTNGYSNGNPHHNSVHLGSKKKEKKKKQIWPTRLIDIE